MAPSTPLARLWLFVERGAVSLKWLQPAAQLAARCYVGSVFFAAVGLSKGTWYSSVNSASVVSQSRSLVRPAAKNTEPT